MLCSKAEGLSFVKIRSEAIILYLKLYINFYSYSPYSALNRHTVRLFTESDDTRGYNNNNTICPPEEEQGTARNMLRIIM